MVTKRNGKIGTLSFLTVPSQKTGKPKDSDFWRSLSGVKALFSRKGHIPKVTATANFDIVQLLPRFVKNVLAMSNQYDDGYMEWQPGAWIECKETHERGQVKPHRGKRMRVDLGPGIMLFASFELLKHQGWHPLSNQPRETS